MKDNALAEWYRSHGYDLRSEIYKTLRVIKRNETRNRKEINKSIDKPKKV